jgi:hypothetical protein
MNAANESTPHSIPLAELAKEICRQVLQLDNAIRFAGVANNMGRLIAYSLQRGLQPLLNEEELRDNIMKSTLRMKTREDYEFKLGDVIYTFALYRRVKRATIPLNNIVGLSILTISFDMAADHESIILNKILPTLDKLKQSTTRAVNA